MKSIRDRSARHVGAGNFSRRAAGHFLSRAFLDRPLPTPTPAARLAVPLRLHLHVALGATAKGAA